MIAPTELGNMTRCMIDADRLRQLLEVKQRQKEEAMHIEDTQRLVTEIEMLKVVLFLFVEGSNNGSTVSRCH